MSSAADIDVAMRFALALADRLLESQEVGALTARLKDRVRSAPQREHPLLMDILVALAMRPDHPEMEVASRN